VYLYIKVHRNLYLKIKFIYRCISFIIFLRLKRIIYKSISVIKELNLGVLSHKYIVTPLTERIS